MSGEASGDVKPRGSVSSMKAAYDSRIQEKDKKQAVIHGSKGAALPMQCRQVLQLFAAV